MKKTNNKYRNNNNNNSSNNTIYSLNYKFDSNSIAGKISGTALDLIKRYNDFAKDAQSNSDYVNAEIFRQYAEHYRKIVTEINERKNQMRPIAPAEANDNRDNTVVPEMAAPVVAEENQDRTPTVEPSIEQAAETTIAAVQNEVKTPRREVKKSFKIIEISHAKADEAKAENKTENAVSEPVSVPAATPKRVYRRKAAAVVS